MHVFRIRKHCKNDGYNLEVQVGNELLKNFAGALAFSRKIQSLIFSSFLSINKYIFSILAFESARTCVAVFKLVFHIVLVIVQLYLDIITVECPTSHS